MAGKSGGPTRSSGTGRYVSPGQGKSNPSGTVREALGKSGSTGGAYRSSSTGRFVTEKYGKQHPGTTTREK